MIREDLMAFVSKSQPDGDQVGGEVAVRPAGSVELPGAVSGRLAELLANAPRDDEGEGLGNLIGRILNAETLDDAAAVLGGMDNSKAVAGIGLMITGFVLRDSDYLDDPNSLPVYASIRAHRLGGKDAGKAADFNSGALQVIALLVTAHERQWFPFAAHVEAKQIKRTGRTAYNLVID